MEVQEGYLIWDQGDQIGRIFAHWVTIYFGHSFENKKQYTASLGYFFHG
jgi:hypothetical protein